MWFPEGAGPDRCNRGSERCNRGAAAEEVQQRGAAEGMQQRWSRWGGGEEGRKEGCSSLGTVGPRIVYGALLWTPSGP